MHITHALIDMIVYSASMSQYFFYLNSPHIIRTTIDLIITIVVKSIRNEGL